MVSAKVNTELQAYGKEIRRGDDPMRKGMPKLGVLAFMVAGGLGASSTPPIYANQPSNELNVVVAPVKIPRAYGRVVAAMTNYMIFESADRTIRAVRDPAGDKPIVVVIHRD